MCTVWLRTINSPSKIYSTCCFFFLKKKEKRNRKKEKRKKKKPLVYKKVSVYLSKTSFNYYKECCEIGLGGLRELRRKEESNLETTKAKGKLSEQGAFRENSCGLLRNY